MIRGNWDSLGNMWIDMFAGSSFIVELYMNVETLSATVYWENMLARSLDRVHPVV